MLTCTLPCINSHPISTSNSAFEPQAGASHLVLALLSLEEKNGAMSEVHIDEVLRLVGNEAAEVPADDAVPCCALTRVEL